MIKILKNLMTLISILCITCIIFTTNCTYAVNFDEESDNSTISSDSMYDEEVDGEQSENTTDSNSSNITSNTNSSNNTNTNSSNTTNTTSTNEALNTATVTSVTDNDSSDGLQLSDILNILLIVIGTLLILLAIAIIIRLKG